MVLYAGSSNVETTDERDLQRVRDIKFDSSRGEIELRITESRTT